jgi:hypothetical protein
MATYLQYIGTEPNHTVSVQTPQQGNNDSAGTTTPFDTRQVVMGAETGAVVALYPDVAAAVLTAEPTLWQAVSGFTG